MRSVDKGWISVRERLPDRELAEHREKYPGEVLEVIARIAGAEIATVLVYDGDDFVDPLTGESCPVTHWMPLPLPPKDKEEAAQAEEGTGHAL